MCIVVLAWQLIPDCPVLLLSNRDEFHNRNAMQLHDWIDQHIVAGLDDDSKGTWLGLNRCTQKWAVVTNYRERLATIDLKSRGALVKDYLSSDLSPLAFAQRLPMTEYAGFNLIVGDLNQAVVCGNRGTTPTVLGSGLFTLSNGLISDKWPKMARLKLLTEQKILPLMSEHRAGHPFQQVIIDSSWQVLEDEQKAADHVLPQTGIDVDLEKLLSSIFIQSTGYGTRVSNLMKLDRFGYDFIEKTHVPTIEPVITRLSDSWS